MITKLVSILNKENYLKHIIIQESQKYFQEIITKSSELKPNELESVILLLKCINDVLKDIVHMKNEINVMDYNFNQLNITLDELSNLIPEYVMFQINECQNLIQNIVFLW